jgi:hypothetical protein
MSKAIEKLPAWAKVILFVLAIIAGVYSISRDGFWTFLLKVIFSP